MQVFVDPALTGELLEVLQCSRGCHLLIEKTAVPSRIAANSVENDVQHVVGIERRSSDRKERHHRIEIRQRFGPGANVYRRTPRRSVPSLRLVLVRGVRKVKRYEMAVGVNE